MILPALLAALLLVTEVKSAGLEDVDMALVLVMDVSDSVDEDEFTLQRIGTASAFVDPEIVNAISRGSLGKIAVSVIEFANEAVLVVPWTMISDSKSARLFSSMMTSTSRNHEIGTGTSISSGLALADNLIITMPYRATRRVIDVSGDGTNNTDAVGTNIEATTELAKSLHVVINGLTIGDDFGLEEFYLENVITGPGAFKLHSDSYKDFTKAMRRKLIREIS